jgi:hypothetical protein
MTGLILLLNGSVLTTILRLPMRLGGVFKSIISVAGNAAYEALDEAAETIAVIAL